MRVFISYNKADKDWAEWIAWTLEEAGYSVVIQAWDFRPGGNFALEMQKASAETEKTVLVLSENYLKAEFTQPEWAAAFASDPQGWKRKLIPVRVTVCEPGGLLGQIIYVDLVGLSEKEARNALLGAFAERAKPAQAPAFPGATPAAGQPTHRRVMPGPVQYPGAAKDAGASPWNVPIPRNPFFTGRKKILADIESGLRSGALVALSGIGGVGKTQTAAHFAHEHRADYTAVLWASAVSEATLVSDFAAIAGLLNLPEKDEKDQTLAVAAVKRWLEDNTGWLLILDNADDLKLARECIPQQAKGHILLTTRARAMGGLAQRVEIEEMEPDEGAHFLLRRAGVIVRDAQLDAASQADRELARQISRELGGLPLALDQAGAFIDETPWSLREYLELYKSEGVRLRAERGDLGDHPSVTVTFSLAFQKVAESSASAADLVRLCAFFAPDAIPEEIFTEGAAELGKTLSPVAADKLEFAKALKEAGRFSLIDRDPQNRTIDIHRLVQAVVKDGMPENEKRQWSERAVRAVNQVFPTPDFPNWARCERLVPQALACASLVGAYSLEFKEAARLLNGVGYYLDDRARYSDAEPLYRRALTIREKALGPDHRDVATCLNNLALLYSNQSKYALAEPLYERALAIFEKARGSDHPDVATSLNNLALLYTNQGKYVRAEPLYQRALAIFEKARGSDDPDVATSLNNLAGLYSSQGKYAEAESLYKRALAIDEKSLGPDHPHVATDLNNLAFLYWNQGKYAEAEPFYQRALAIYEKALGPDHPNVATVLENYARLLREMKRNAEAETMEARAKAIRAAHAKSNPPGKT
jgi:tetratricopeptide (TPR) repeat protein